MLTRTQQPRLIPRFARSHEEQRNPLAKATARLLLALCLAFSICLPLPLEKAHALDGGCSRLISVNLSGLDTSMAMNMGYMFYNCSSLETLIN